MNTFEFKVGDVVYRPIVYFDEYDEHVSIRSGSVVKVADWESPWYRVDKRWCTADELYSTPEEAKQSVRERCQRHIESLNRQLKEL